MSLGQGILDLLSGKTFRKMAEESVAKAAVRVVKVWQDQDRQLNGHLTYTKTLEINQHGKECSIYPTAYYAKYLEFGTRPHSLKEGLLKNARIGKHGKYRVVAFKHKMSIDVSMALAGISMGVAKTKTTPGNVNYTWKAGMYEGIKASASGPVTFRTVTEDSPPGSWMHPGTKPMHLIEKTKVVARRDLRKIHLSI